MSINKPFKPIYSRKKFFVEHAVWFGLKNPSITFFDLGDKCCYKWFCPHPVKDEEDLYAWYEQTIEFNNGYAVYFPMDMPERPLPF